MKKKLSLFLCLMIFAMMFLVGCSKQESIDPEIASKIEDKLGVVINDVVVDVSGDSYVYYTEEDRNNQLSFTADDWNVKQELLKENHDLVYSSQDVYSSAVLSCIDGEKESGEIKNVSEDIEIGTYDEGYTANWILVYSERTVDMTVLLDNDLTITSVVFNPVYTIGENLTKAALNTLMGMGTVIIILILIMCIIMMFKLIPAIEKKIANKKSSKAATDASVSKTIDTIAAKEEDELADDLELVAVISAAIAAYEGSSGTDGFVVRSIRKSNSKKWQSAQY